MKKLIKIAAWALVAVQPLKAQSTEVAASATGAPVNWASIMLVVTAIALAVVVMVMGTLVARVALLKVSKAAEKTLKSLVMVGLFLQINQAQAAIGDFTWKPSVDTVNGMLLGLIFLELLLIFYFANWLRALVLPPKPVKLKAERTRWGLWWDRVNKSVSVEKEADVQLDHDYDGIRELDNALPPWWLYGFYLTIVFAAIYAWRYHYSQSAPLQVEELAIENQNAERALALYHSQAAEQVDENNVPINNAPEFLAKGRETFEKNCISCHGDLGQGASIGPNLSDAYWLHGGDMNSIFRTIKYGVPEKGMVAWGQQLSVSKIAELASYVWSLQGSNPENPKEAQGELYEPKAAVDSSSVAMSILP
jgi:cytochrome c oxidase cbb3-type subunit 3